jgi:Membrane protease subunits, stomatin/prohibitin homologs
MTTNRHLINDFDVIRPQQLLDKGLPLPFLSGRYVVDEGWNAVITEGGAFKEILGPGTHFLEKYHFFRDVKASAVNIKINTMTVSTTREFTIQKPVPVEINLDVAVEYQVKDPRRVATEITTPLTSLYDRVLQAVRSAVVFATVDEIRTQGEGIAQATMQRLQAMQLPKVLGIEIFNVLVTSIKATDTGSDVLAQQQMSEFTRVRDWQLDSAIVQGTQITPQWMMINRPEIYAQIMAGNFQVVKELIDKGLLDPAAFLNQASGAPSFDPSRLLGGFGTPGMPSQFGGNPTMPIITDQGSAEKDINARIREEVGYLKNVPGASVENKPGQDDDGVPDGSFDLRVTLPRASGGTMTVYIACPKGFPITAPTLDVEVDGEDAAFQSAVLRRWSGQYLVEIVREAKQYFG